MLETLGIPYSGSGVLASSLCMDKDLSKRLLRAEGIATPDWVCLERSSWSETPAASGGSRGNGSPDLALAYPLFVKPNGGGSSIGVRRVDGEGELRAALEEAFRWDRSVVVESMVHGQEITCSVLGGELLPIWESGRMERHGSIIAPNTVWAGRRNFPSLCLPRRRRTCAMWRSPVIGC
ncbi:hypothetical protein HMSSN036_97150 [Paenibacillus macerans]|nr:hypothetical protein HMSSN036_97150 [Paenibacillus macerans]